MARPNEDPEWENPKEKECIMYDLGYLEGQKETEENMVGLGIMNLKAYNKLIDLWDIESSVVDMPLMRTAYFRGRADARKDKIEGIINKKS